MVVCGHEHILRRKAGVLSALCLLLFLVPAVSAAGAHYEFDKSYYRPGDFGYFLVEVSNNRPESVDIPEAALNITGIGTFAWDPSTTNASDLHSASMVMTSRWSGYYGTNDTYLGQTLGCRIESGGSATFYVYFKIPENASKGEYSYRFYMPIITDIPVDVQGAIAVYPQGEVPPPDVVGDALSLLGTAGLLLLLVLSPVYLVLRWKKRARAAKYAKIVLILSVVLVCAVAWKIISFAMYLSFVFFPFWPLLVLIIIVVLLWRRRRRKRKKLEQTAKASTNVT